MTKPGRCSGAQGRGGIIAPAGRLGWLMPAVTVLPFFLSKLCEFTLTATCFLLSMLRALWTDADVPSPAGRGRAGPRGGEGAENGAGRWVGG